MASNSNHAPQLQSTKKATKPTFALFKRLPPELQDNIWQCAIDNVSPRIVELRRGQLKELPDGDFLWTNQITSTCPIPSILHTCRAARQLAMKRWTLAFAFRTQCPKIFFDFHNDTLYFGGRFDNMSLFVKDTGAADRGSLRKIAFDLQEQWDNGYYEGGRKLAKKLHRDFPGITNLIFTEVNLELEDNGSMDESLTYASLSKHTIVTFTKALEAWSCEGFSYTQFERTFVRNNWAVPRIRHADYFRTPSHIPLTGDEYCDVVKRKSLDDESSEGEGLQIERAPCNACGEFHEEDDDDSDDPHEETEDDVSSGRTDDEFDDDSEDLEGEIEVAIVTLQHPDQKAEEYEYEIEFGR